MESDLIMDEIKNYDSANSQRFQPCVSRSKFREAVNGPVPTKGIIDQGLEIYLDYVESQITTFSASSDGIIDLSFDRALSRPEERLTWLWGLATKVAHMLTNLDRQCTLEHLAEELVKSYKLKESSANAERDSRCAQYLVFYCIGWITLCYIPTSDSVCKFFGFETYSAYHSNSINGSSSVSKRPLGAVLRDFMPIRCRPEVSCKNELQSPGRTLTVAGLNYDSLHHIGKLSIEWTEKLSDHCLLDSSRRRLKLFRFPAFCAQMVIGQKGENILTWIVQAHSCRRDCKANMPHAVHQYLYEVLLSYRLLFGINERSRKLFNAEARPKSSCNRGCDPVLSTLCGQKNASKIANLIPGFVDAGTFDTRTDFPELGERLWSVQEYNANQKPTRLIDIWNDHRDPHQNYTFWAVVIVGATSILLSFLQVVVNIAQLVVAARQN